MLTKKELLKVRRQKEKIIPCFINPSDHSLLECAHALCEVFGNSLGKTRREVEEDSQELLQIFDVDPIVAQGLKKLCFDNLNFESTLLDESSEFRHQIFERSFAVFKENNFNEVTQFQEQVVIDINSKHNQKLSMAEIAASLYSDLPEFHKVTQMKDMNPPALLHKYNVALVQGLLFYCAKMTLIIPAQGKYLPQMRQLIRHLKFFQLVARFVKKELSFEIEIDGPLSLFSHTQKYGFNLACFFPALLFMPEWELRAQIELGKEQKKCGNLNLTHKLGLTTHYKNYSAYVPAEFNLFVQSFQKLEQTEWVINENCEEVLFDGENYFFPDFSFIHQEKGIIYCELFHPWHAAALTHRILALQKAQPLFKLILGVVRPLLKDANLALSLESCEYLKDSFFGFKDMPLPSKVLELLNKTR